MINQCPKCGNFISNRDAFCSKCGYSLSNQENSVKEPLKAPNNTNTNPTHNNSSNIILYVIAGLVAFFLLFGGGLIAYKVFIKNGRNTEESVGKEYKKTNIYYVFAPRVYLRSTMDAGAKFNKIDLLNYGTKLILKSTKPNWSYVEESGTGMAGYMATPYILEQRDFMLLNSIFGNSQSKMVINSARCRRALLNYFKENNLIGNISSDVATKLCLPQPTENNQWQVFCVGGKNSPDNVYYKKLYNKKSKFQDFAVIIENIHSGQRRLLYFYFDSDETPHLAGVQDAPNYGKIQKITSVTKVQNGCYVNVEYINFSDL